MSITPIFIFSLPRSGSTLLQRLMASSTAIHSVSEPWVLLSPFYPFLKEDVYSTNGHSILVSAVEDFIGTLPNSEDSYYSAVRDFALNLYEASSDGERYFLDKTPRYHLVVQHIVKTFPDAKFVFLWRNPMAIVASMVQTWGPQWRIHRHYVDLYKGLQNLVSTFEEIHSKALAIKYEDMVVAPAETMSRVETFLELDKGEILVDNLAPSEVKGRMGDPTGAIQYSSVVTAPQEKWKHILGSHIRKNWCQNYITWIGAERLKIMGYDLHKLNDDIASIRPSFVRTVEDVPGSLYGKIHAPLEINIMRRAYSRWRTGEDLYAHY